MASLTVLSYGLLKTLFDFSVREVPVIKDGNDIDIYIPNVNVMPAARPLHERRRTKNANAAKRIQIKKEKQKCRTYRMTSDVWYLMTEP